MANLRERVGKQISEITHPRILKASELQIESPEVLAFDEYLEEETSSAISIPVPEILVLTDNLYAEAVVSVFGGNAAITKPCYDIASDIVPIRSVVENIDISLDTQRELVELPIVPEYQKEISSNLSEVDLNLASWLNLQIYETLIDAVNIENVLFIFKNVINIFPAQFTPISPMQISIFGMNYADKHWRKIIIPRDERFSYSQQKQTIPTGTEREIISQFKKREKKNKPHIHQTTIWDLLFAVLQPPLTLGKTEHLLLPHDLYPYQRQGVTFLWSNEHALLADDMGTGKTVMSTVALKIMIQQAKAHHVLILCPKSVLHEWQHHLDEWAPELSSYLVRSNQKEERKVLWQMPMHVYVTTYDTLRRDMDNDILPKNRYSFFDTVILDEAHHIKNKNSSRHKAIKKLKPIRRWALTGTPVQNKIDDLAAIFEFIHPGYLNPSDLYAERIQEKIQPHFLRRRKKDVMPDLPPKMLQLFELDLDEEQEIAYRCAEEGIREELTNMGTKVTKQHIFAKLNILKQICNFAPGRLTSPKTELLIDQIEEIVGDDDKVIVFSQYAGEGVNKLEKILEPYGVAKIIGDQSDSNRLAAIENFKKNKKTSVLIASLRAGGEGLNLTEASYVVHFDHWWNPAVMWQAEDRVHRRGQTKGVNVYSYWMKDTVDDRIRRKLKEKGILFEQVVDGLATSDIEELITTDEWLEILGVKKLDTATKAIFNSKIWQSLSLSEIQTKMYEIKPSEFEELVRELMHYLGYPNVKVTGKSHDGGIDVLSTRTTPTGVERVAAQCKRYHGNVSVNIAREFFGAISSDKNIKMGFLVTTGEFTPDARQFCLSTGIIRAISGIELAKYVKQFGLEVNKKTT